MVINCILHIYIFIFLLELEISGCTNVTSKINVGNFYCSNGPIRDHYFGAYFTVAL